MTNWVYKILCSNECLCQDLLHIKDTNVRFYNCHELIFLSKKDDE
jgi:hypothetical protein